MNQDELFGSRKTGVKAAQQQLGCSENHERIHTPKADLLSYIASHCARVVHGRMHHNGTLTALMGVSTEKREKKASSNSKGQGVDPSPLTVVSKKYLLCHRGDCGGRTTPTGSSPEATTCRFRPHECRVCVLLLLY